MKRMTKKKLKNEIKWLDYLIIGTIFLMLVARVLTIIIVGYTADTTGAEIDSVFQVYEQNPIAKMFGQIKGMQTMLVFVLFPAMTVAMYVYFRRKVFQGKMELDQLVLFSTLLLFVIIMDVLNDAAVLVGMML